MAVLLCFSFAQASLICLRLAVGMVAHVDLPVDDLLAAVAKSASTEVVEAMQTSTSYSDSSDAAAQRQSYAAMRKWMRIVETPSRSVFNLRSKCPGCGSTQKQRCVCVSWKSQMVRVPNGMGGLVWVKTTNEADYKAKVALESSS